MTATAWYVYGVIASGAAGVEPTRLVEAESIAALVDQVPLADFGEDVLPARLNDRVWLEDHVRRHQDVLQEIAAATPVVPFRFGTIYRDADDVRAMLRVREAELSAALERVRGRVEIGVKAWADPLRVQPTVTEPSTGRAYLERRRSEQEEARRAVATLADAAHDVHARLLSHALEGVANRPQPRELSDREETMILNGAYLVSDKEAIAAEVGELAERYASQGITFELTGPWPPYNFVDTGSPR